MGFERCWELEGRGVLKVYHFLVEKRFYIFRRVLRYGGVTPLLFFVI